MSKTHFHVFFPFRFVKKNHPAIFYLFFYSSHEIHPKLQSLKHLQNLLCQKLCLPNIIVCTMIKRLRLKNIVLSKSGSVWSCFLLFTSCSCEPRHFVTKLISKLGVYYFFLLLWLTKYQPKKIWKWYNNLGYCIIFLTWIKTTSLTLLLFRFFFSQLWALSQELMYMWPMDNNILKFPKC